ncbi:MAG: hypothetical protein ACYC2E_16890 [Sulfuricella sp.]
MGTLTGSVDATSILKHCSPHNAEALSQVGELFLRGEQPSLEAQAANLADEIAYNNHGVDDGLRSGRAMTCARRRP